MAAPARLEPPQTTDPAGPALLPRTVWTVVAAIVLAVAAITAGILWEPSPDGLPDAGRLVVDGIPAVRLVQLLAGGALLGFTLSAVALDPGAAGPSAGIVTAAGRRDLRIAITAAIILTASSALLAVLTLADVLGLPLREVLEPGVVNTYLWDVDTSRAHAIAAILAAITAIGLAMSRSLGPAASWGAVGAIAVGVPSLTGHAAGLGGHSLALISGFVHTVAASVWGGGVVAVATHAARREPALGERIRRFGVVAIISVIALAATGVASAVTRMSSFGELFSTEYGRMVLGKVTALVVAGAVGLWVRRAWQGLRAPAPGPAGRRPDAAADVPAEARPGVGRLLIEVAALGAALGLAVVLARSPFPRVPIELPSSGESIIGFPWPPSPTFASVAFGWHPDWVWLTVSLLMIGLYLWGYWSLRARGDAWPAGRSVSWVLGWLVVIWATCAGVAWYAPVSFALHMISHMALAMLAPVLMVMGGPITLALRVLPAAHGGARGPREWITWALHSPVSRFVTHPLYALFIFTIGLYGLYYTRLYEWLMASHLGHFYMQVHFLAAGYLFYWVVIGVDAGPRKLGYPARLILLMASLVIHSLFAVPMMMTEVPMVQGWYELVQPPWLTDPLRDTQIAGAIAWGFGELPTLVVAIALGFQWARSDEKEARRIDRRADLDGDAELRAYNERLARLNAQPPGEPADRR